MKEKRTPVEWAFRWVADFPEVTTILSGMSSYAQLENNLRIFEDLKPGSLSSDEKKIISAVADKFHELIEYDCTKCRYCMPCPEKIDIPRTIDLYNQLGTDPDIYSRYQDGIQLDGTSSAVKMCNLQKM